MPEEFVAVGVHGRGVDGYRRGEHAQDFSREVASGPMETAVLNLLNRALLVLILVEIMQTVLTTWSPSPCSRSAWWR